MSASSSAELLALHGVRVLGSATSGQVAGLYGLDAAEVAELLLDAEAYGWVTRYPSGLPGVAGYGLTDRGRARNQAALAAELDQVAARAAVHEVYDAFLPLNGRLTDACTRWQLRPTRADPWGANDHRDWGWDSAVIDDLVRIGDRLDGLSEQLTAALTRFGIHAPRFRAALDRVERGERSWVDAPDRASCHLVWIQLHEDLLATLGIERGA